jgi:hypothetical protein
MSTPRRRPDPVPPHGSEGERLRNAKGAGVFAGGRGFSDSPHSHLFKIGIAIAVIVIIGSVIMSITDMIDSNSKSKNSQPAPTIAAPPAE